MCLPGRLEVALRGINMEENYAMASDRRSLGQQQPFGHNPFGALSSGETQAPESQADPNRKGSNTPMRRFPLGRSLRILSLAVLSSALVSRNAHWERGKLSCRARTQNTTA